MTRPRLEEIERYLDAIGRDRELARWLLEDIAGIEDSPETDEEIMKLKKRLEQT